MQNVMKVRLVSALDQSAYGTPQYIGKRVEFDAAPVIVESGSVNYDSVELIHGPTSYQMYRSTPARTFSLGSVKLFSRTPTEARNNLKKLATLRSWRMPYFGNTDSSLRFQSSESGTPETFMSDKIPTASDIVEYTRFQNSLNSLKTRLGAPPEVLLFSAYSPSNSTEQGFPRLGLRGNIDSIPVVLTSLRIEYPDDVAYVRSLSISTSDLDPFGNTPFPTIMTIGIELTETHSPAEVNKFNLANYEAGILEGF